MPGDQRDLSRQVSCPCSRDAIHRLGKKALVCKITSRVDTTAAGSACVKHSQRHQPDSHGLRISRRESGRRCIGDKFAEKACNKSNTILVAMVL